MQISIVIPTYNGAKLLEQTLPHTLTALQKFIRYEIIIVDNNSQDNTKNLIKSSYPAAQVIILDKNYGFTRAVNEGVKIATCEYVCILNNDCFVEKDTFKKLYDFLRSHQEYVATQPIVLKREMHNAKREMIENIGYIVDLKKGKAKVIRNYKLEMLNYKFDKPNIFQNGKVYGLSATCLLIRKDVFLKIGMFDEAFHSYLEDVDLFIRLAKNGYQYGPCLNAYAKHQHMATSSKMGSYKESHDLSNWIRIIIKNYPWWFILLHFPTLFVERLRNLSGYLKKAAF